MNADEHGLEDAGAVKILGTDPAMVSISDF